MAIENTAHKAGHFCYNTGTMNQEIKSFSPENELSAPEIPYIYKLIESEAPTDKIVQEIYAEFYRPDSSAERLCLGFQELLDRGNEGVSALTFLGKGTDDLAALALKLSENPRISPYELENNLGIKRWSTVRDNRKVHSDPNSMMELVEYGKKKGYIPRHYSMEDCFAPLINTMKLGLHPHLDETIDDDILSTSATFGTVEPTYLELLGAKEILRLRGSENINMLLLGSLGKYSSREFTSYARKISSKIDPSTLDIDYESLNLVKNDPDNKGDKMLVQGNALELPFADESMDHVYTNYLVRFLFRAESIEEDPVKLLLREARRVLKPGGSLVVAEAPYGKHGNSERIHESKKDFISAALQAKFLVVPELPRYFGYILRAEVGTSKISENGFGDYKDSFLVEDPSDETLNLRLIKPAA